MSATDRLTISHVCMGVTIHVMTSPSTNTLHIVSYLNHITMSNYFLSGYDVSICKILLFYDVSYQEKQLALCASGTNCFKPITIKIGEIVSSSSNSANSFQFPNQVSLHNPSPPCYSFGIESKRVIK